MCSDRQSTICVCYIRNMNFGVTVAVFLAVTVSLVLSGKISLFIYLFICLLLKEDGSVSDNMVSNSRILGE